MRFNNNNRFTEKTHEGGKAKRLDAKQEIIKMCVTSLLENKFYESGEDQIKRLQSYLENVDADFVLKVAIFSREYGLRSINHFITAWYVKNYAGQEGIRGKLTRFLNKIVRRPDELGEILGALTYLNGGKFVFPNSLKIAFGEVLKKFDDYQLAKYRNKGDIKLYDIINLGHYKGYEKLMTGKLKSAETWEKKLSSGEEKDKAFTELLKENKLGAVALFKNLRNMLESDVDQDLIVSAIDKANTKGIFPYEIMKSLWATKHMTNLTSSLVTKVEEAAVKSFGNLGLEGKTAVLVDTSGSMTRRMSNNSDMSYIHIASFYGAMAEKNGGVSYAWATDTRRPNIMAWDGLLRIAHAITNTDVGMGTNIQQAIDYVKNDYDNIIVFSDMQTTGYIQDTGKAKNVYLFDLSGYKNSINLNGRFVEMAGFTDVFFKLCKDLRDLKPMVKYVESIEIN